MVTRVPSDNDDSFVIDLARAEALSWRKLASSTSRSQLENFPVRNYILLEHANIESLDCVNIWSIVIVDSTEHKKRMIFEGAAAVVVALGV